MALFWFVLSRVDGKDLLSRLSGRQIALALLGGVVVLEIQTVVAAVRLRVCARLLERELGQFAAWTACQLGGFFSHTPASFVGGDGLRIWHLVMRGMPTRDAGKTVLMDRALGFIGMMILVIAVSPALQVHVPDPAMRSGYLLLVGLGLTAAAAFLSLGRLRLGLGGRLAGFAEYATVSRHLYASPWQAAEAVTLAVLVNAINPVAIWLIALAYGVDIDLSTALIACPVVFLVAMIPVSVAGWGLREGAIVVALGLYGVPSADALTLSVTFGVAVLLSYSPAVVLFLLAKRRAGPTAKAQEFGPASSPPTGRS